MEQMLLTVLATLFPMRCLKAVWSFKTASLNTLFWEKVLLTRQKLLVGNREPSSLASLTLFIGNFLNSIFQFL